MRRILILLLVILPLRLLADGVEIIADVDGEPISSLDIEKRVKLLSGNQKEEVKSQIMKQLIDEIIIINESQKLNIKLSDKELNNAIVLFFTQNFGLKTNEERNKYIKKHDIDLNILTRQVKCQLLWNKIIETRIVPFLNEVSDEEVDNFKRQMEKPDYLITFQEVIIPNQEGKHLVENLVKRLHDDSNFIPEPPIKVHKTTASLNQLKGELKSTLEKLEVGDITDPSNLSGDHYSIIKVMNKVKLSYELLNSILSLKQTIVKDQDGVLENLKKQKVDCLSFDKLANNLKLPNVKEFKIKMEDLNPDLQIVFSTANMNEIVKIKEGNAVRLMMLCNIESNTMNVETVKQQIYQQKVMVQSNLLFENIRKNAIVIYHR